jgi:Flp pilus assembly protein TadB
VIVLVAVAAVAAAFCWPAPRRPLARIRHLRTTAARPVRPPDAGVRRPLLVLGGIAVLVVVLAGGAWWWAAALATAGVLGARARPTAGPDPDAIPLAADLMSACLRAGATLPDAVAAATGSGGPWLHERTRPVVAALRAGAPPAEAWRPWLADERLAPVAHTCVRTAGSGAAAAAELLRVAARLRARQRTVTQHRVARASVWVVLPLGLCFLPAFVLVGVVPLVLSLLAGMR